MLLVGTIQIIKVVHLSGMSEARSCCQCVHSSFLYAWSLYTYASVLWHKRCDTATTAPCPSSTSCNILTLHRFSSLTPEKKNISNEWCAAFCITLFHPSVLPPFLPFLLSYPFLPFSLPTFLSYRFLHPFIHSSFLSTRPSSFLPSCLPPLPPSFISSFLPYSLTHSLTHSLT